MGQRLSASCRPWFNRCLLKAQSNIFLHKEATISSAHNQTIGRALIFSRTTDISSYQQDRTH